MGTSLSWRVMPDKNSGLSKLNYFLQVLSWNYRQMRQIYMSDLMEMNFHIECVFSIPRFDSDDNRKTLLCGKKYLKLDYCKLQQIMKWYFRYVQKTAGLV